MSTRCLFYRADRFRRARSSPRSARRQFDRCLPAAHSWGRPSPAELHPWHTAQKGRLIHGPPSLKGEDKWCILADLQGWGACKLRRSHATATGKPHHPHAARDAGGLRWSARQPPPLPKISDTGPHPCSPESASLSCVSGRSKAEDVVARSSWRDTRRKQRHPPGIPVKVPSLTEKDEGSSTP
jgi:hypothetical protein